MTECIKFIRKEIYQLWKYLVKEAISGKRKE